MKPLEDGLEGMIERGKLAEDGPVGVFLKTNPAAREEVTGMIEISCLIRENFKLNAPEAEALEVSPGFYARVLARIEAEAAAPTIWNFFLEPFGRRLVYASLALATLLFAATLFDSAPFDPTPVHQPDIASTAPSPVLHGAVLASDSNDMPVVESSNQEEDRSRTLVQLTTYNQ